MQPRTLTIMKASVSLAAFVAGFMMSIGFLTIFVPNSGQIEVFDDYYDFDYMVTPPQRQCWLRGIPLMLHGCL